MNRRSQQHRRTAETDVALSLDLDGLGRSSVSTGIGFLDHMLTALSTHSGMDLDLQVQGDLGVDAHHTTEDVGIVLGDGLRSALGEKAGVARFGFSYVPMDEALVRSVVDLSGRSYLYYSVSVRARRVGGLDTELVEDFLQAVASHGRLTLHVDMLRGRNSHHIVEAVFKSFGRALGQAITRTGAEGILSTKGTLTS